MTLVGLLVEGYHFSVDQVLLEQSLDIFLAIPLACKKLSFDTNAEIYNFSGQSGEHGFLYQYDIHASACSVYMTDLSRRGPVLVGQHWYGVRVEAIHAHVY